MYKKYSDILNQKFGGRVQKISVNAGFTCPNRDGSKGRGGCIYCNNLSFSPAYCKSQSTIEEQLEEGMRFFQKYKSQQYIAYFQSYTNTYIINDKTFSEGLYGMSEKSFNMLIDRYERALSVSGVVGIAVGTRPDCVTEQLLDYFADLSKRRYVLIEYGVESTNNITLEEINRGHTFEDSVWAIEATAKRGIATGVHLILGLPHEDRDEIMKHAERIAKLPVDVLKLHQLQIIKDTVLCERYMQNPHEYPLFTLDQYIELLIDFIEALPPHIALDRFISQSPAEWLVAPNWNIKNFEFVHKLEKRMKARQAYQGRIYKA